MIVLIDSKSVTDGSAQLDQLSSEALLFRTGVSRKLPVGVHEGRLLALLCTSQSNACESQAAAPIEIPYRVTVRKGLNLTPLMTLPAGGDWNSLQGGPAHTGFVPVDLDPTRFIQRYRWRPVGDSSLTHHPLTVGSHTIVAGDFRDPQGSHRRLHAISEATGSTVWETGHGSPVGSSGGSLFVPTLEFSNATNTVQPRMVTLDAMSGAQLRSVSGTSFAYGGGAAVDGEILYGATGRLNLSTGTWTDVLSENTTPFPRRPDPWAAVTVLGDKWYSFSPESGSGLLQAVDKATGRLIHADNSFQLPLASTTSQTVLSRCSENLLLISTEPNYIIGYDMASRTVRWLINDRTGHHMACDQNSLFVVVGATIEQRSLDSGKIEFEWKGPHKVRPGFAPPVVQSNLVLTNRHLFFSYGDLSARVYALDRTTRQLVWSDVSPGIARLAISKNGLLIVQGTNEIRVFNLR